MQEQDRNQDAVLSGQAFPPQEGATLGSVDCYLNYLKQLAYPSREGLKFSHPDLHGIESVAMTTAEVLNYGTKIIVLEKTIFVNRYIEILPSNVPLEMIFIPGESLVNFLENQKIGRNSCLPSFWMSRYPITQIQWQALAQGHSYIPSNPSHFKGNQYPV